MSNQLKTRPSPSRQATNPKDSGRGNKAAPTRSTESVKTERWPANTLKSGHFIQVPKVLIKRLGKLKLEPRHLWLLLMLQSERYRDRHPRYYWAELGAACGKSKETVRKWGYELQVKGLLRIRPTRQLNEGEERRPGARNERNEFLLRELEDRLEVEQVAMEAERAAKRTRHKK